MSIEFLCPNCNQKMSADASLCGTSAQCPACNASFVVPQFQSISKASSQLNAVKVSWWMIGITCLLSMIPGIGFLIWIIAGPILCATIVLGIIALTKGQKSSGALILICSFIIAPVFIAIAPIVSTAIVGSAIDTKSPQHQNVVASNEPSVENKPQTQKSSGNGFHQMGETITLKDSTWIVLEAKELGKSLPETMLSNAKHSEGRFVYVKFRVTNNTNKEESILFEPTIRDSKNRSFEQLADASLPNDEESIGLEPLPASIPKTFSAIFEVAEDSTDLLFMTRTFDSFGTQYVPVKLMLKPSAE